jgi:hypothetical protein
MTTRRKGLGGLKENSALLAAAVAVAFLFAEVLRSHLPAMTFTGLRLAWLVAASGGLSLLCVGVGASVVSGVRLLRVMRTANPQLLQASAKDLIWCSSLVAVGFIVSITTLLTMSVLKQ